MGSERVSAVCKKHFAYGESQYSHIQAKTGLCVCVMLFQNKASQDETLQISTTNAFECSEITRHIISCKQTLEECHLCFQFQGINKTEQIAWIILSRLYDFNSHPSHKNTTALSTSLLKIHVPFGSGERTEYKQRGEILQFLTIYRVDVFAQESQWPVAEPHFI